MSVLKRLSRLEMSTHVKECVVLESYAFIDATLLIVTLLFTADVKRAVLVSVLEGFDASEILGLLDFFISILRVQRLLGECALLERKNIRRSVEQKLHLLSHSYCKLNKIDKQRIDYESSVSPREKTFI